MTAISRLVQWHKNASEHQNHNLLLFVGVCPKCLMLFLTECLHPIWLKTSKMLITWRLGALPALVSCLLLQPLLQEHHEVWAQLLICLLMAGVECQELSTLPAAIGCWSKGCDSHSCLCEPEKCLEWVMWERNARKQRVFLGSRKRRLINLKDLPSSDTNTTQKRYFSYSLPLCQWCEDVISCLRKALLFLCMELVAKGLFPCFLWLSYPSENHFTVEQGCDADLAYVLAVGLNYIDSVLSLLCRAALDCFFIELT